MSILESMVKLRAYRYTLLVQQGIVGIEATLLRKFDDEGGQLIFARATLSDDTALDAWLERQIAVLGALYLTSAGCPSPSKPEKRVTVTADAHIGSHAPQDAPSVPSAPLFDPGRQPFSHPLTLGQARLHKSAAQEGITRIIEDFTRDTGLVVQDVNVDKVTVMGDFDGVGRAYIVQIDASL